MRSLRTKPGVRTAIYTVQHHRNSQGNESFRTKQHERKRTRTDKPYKNGYCVSTFLSKIVSTVASSSQAFDKELQNKFFFIITITFILT